MCGIAAIVAPPGHPSLATIRAMCDLVRHRGPDDEGFAFFGDANHPRLFAGADTPDTVRRAFRLPYAPREVLGSDNPSAAQVALGHRRLSIVDLSAAGHQPLCDPEGRFWITYNGEIYNHRELRSELERLGRRFQSATDTEVVVQAYAEWGPDCQQRLNGMWAFVIYDSRTGTLFASRDRFGIKPLYYTLLPGPALAIASEIKQFTALADWRPRTNWQRAWEFLNFGLVSHPPETLFEDVRQLGPGECLTINAREPNPRRTDSQSVRRWYHLSPTPNHDSDERASARFRELLDDSVRLQLRADVPVGSCLSGGLDSSSIVCLMHAHLKRLGQEGLQQAVSSCADEAAFDERPWIREVVARTGVRVHYVFPEEQTLFDALDELAWQQDEPFGSTSMFAQWVVFREARRRNLPVMLDGQGADELLAGYHVFFGAWFAELAASFRWPTLMHEAAACVRRHGYGPRFVLEQGGWRVPMPYFLKRRLRAWLGGTGSLVRRFHRPDGFEQRGVALAATARGAAAAPTSVRAESLRELSSTNLPALLRYEDRNSMAHSVESRVPFLDHRLVEYSLSLPGDMKIRHGRTKHALREALRDVLPPSIVERDDKMGFVTPEPVWFRGPGGERFRDLVRETCAMFPDLFDARAADEVQNAVVEGRLPYDPSLWRVVSFAAWAKRFGVAA